MGVNMKKTLLVITALSLIALILSLGAFRQIQNEGLKSAKEWAMMAVENEHYQLDDDGYLLTHAVVIQTPSLELVEETEGDTYEDYLYVKDSDGNYYMAFFKHYLVVEKYGGKIEEYVYISAIAWEDRDWLNRSLNNAFGIKPKEIGIYQWQIQDLDIEELE